MVVLITAWAMCGAGPGTLVAVSGFALTLFAGPTLGQYVMEQRGVEHHAIIAKVESTHSRHGNKWLCTAVRAEDGKRVFYTLSEETGCKQDFKPFHKVTVVEDPSGWLDPRLNTTLSGTPAWVLWLSAGTLALMEIFILFGRLRRHATPATRRTPVSSTS
ncbi:hypothetical protein [Streptomyces iranensis]|uniref:hypothetical protein n=1 Tax=Streptomyces iranensis TaxID=576784 RepID=UPI0039B72415